MIRKIWAAYALAFVAAFFTSGCGRLDMPSEPSNPDGPTEDQPNEPTPSPFPPEASEPSETNGAEAYTEILRFFARIGDLAEAEALPAFESNFSLRAESIAPYGATWDPESGARVELSRKDVWTEVGTSSCAFLVAGYRLDRRTVREARFLTYQTLRPDRVDETGVRADQAHLRYQKDEIDGEDYAIFTRESDTAYSVGAKAIRAGLQETTSNFALCALLGLEEQARTFSLLRVLSTHSDAVNPHSYYAKSSSTEFSFSFEIASKPSTALRDALTAGLQNDTEETAFDALAGGRIVCAVKLNSQSVPVEAALKIDNARIEICVADVAYRILFSAEAEAIAGAAKVSAITLDDMRAIYPTLNDLCETPSLSSVLLV